MNVAVLPGDGVGPEVTESAVEVLSAAALLHDIPLHCTWHDFGGTAVDRCGAPLPDETIAGVVAADAVLLGAVGGAKWDALPRDMRPETGLLALRKHCGVFANLRPACALGGLESRSLLRADIVGAANLLIVRECAGGLYFGEPRGSTPIAGWNTMRYSRHEVERVAHVAFEAARRRRRRVLHVDKANVLECSAFFREIVTAVATLYPDVRLDHAYVDSAALLLVSRPDSLDVILTENLFGDILSDLAAALPGTLGVLPSASIGGGTPIFEPVHGSAPEIAGTETANPMGAMLSVAMLLDYAAGHRAAARAIERAVHAAARRHPTRDLGGTASTSDFTNVVKEELHVCWTASPRDAYDRSR